MRIIIPTFERIEWMPPTISMIETLVEMGHEVIYITIYPDDFFAAKGIPNIRNISLCKKNLEVQGLLPYTKGVSGLLFRVDNLVKRMVSFRLKGVVDALYDENSLLWVVNEMTVLLGGTSFLKGKKYAFTIYELHERTGKNRCIEVAAKNAVVVAVPEYCRAHIVQSRYALKKTPVVLPNKTTIRFDGQLSDEGQAAIAKLEQRKQQGVTTILYMGGIGPERPLEPILEAIADKKEYRLVVMGRQSGYLQKLQSKYPDQFDYLGAFRPPEHIQVASHADIGLLMYVSVNQKLGLNALFCAPNKLYEYTGQGLPVIANDIPGLRFPVETNQIGVVVDFSKKEAIYQALEKVGRDYQGFAARAKAFYNQLDVKGIIFKILEQLQSSEK